MSDGVLVTGLSVDPSGAVAGYKKSQTAAGQYAKALVSLLKTTRRREEAERQATKATRKASESVARTPHAAAAQKLQAYIQAKQAAVTVAKEYGVSLEVASKAVKAFGEDTERAVKEAGPLAQQLAKVEKESKDLGKAQRKASQSVDRGTAKLKLQIRQLHLIERVMREQNVTYRVAAKAVKAFGDRLDIAEKEAGQLARTLQNAENRLRSSTRQLEKSAKKTSLVTKAMGVLRREVLALAAAYGALEIARKILEVLNQYEGAAIDIAKTTNLSDEAVKGLMKDLDALATGPVRVAIAQFHELAEAAGQVGIQSVEGIALAAETGAKLQIASDLAGKAAITSLSKILKVQGEAVEKIDELGSVIVRLGQVTANTESGITEIASEVAKATSNFKIGSVAAAGLAASYADYSVEADIAGSSTGKLLRALQLASSVGKDLEPMAQIAGRTAEGFRALVDENILEAALVLLEGIGKMGNDAAAGLDAIGLTGIQTAKGLLPLATNIDDVRKKLAIANDEAEKNTALNEETRKNNQKLTASYTALKNALAGLTNEVFSVFLPALKALLDGTTEIILALRRLDDVILSIGLHAAGLGELDQEIAEILGPTNELAAAWDRANAAIKAENTKDVADQIENLEDKIAKLNVSSAEMAREHRSIKESLEDNNFQKTAEDIRVWRARQVELGTQLQLSKKEIEAYSQIVQHLRKHLGDLRDAQKQLSAAELQRSLRALSTEMESQASKARASAVGTRRLIAAYARGPKAVEKMSRELEIEAALQVRVQQARKKNLDQLDAFKKALAELTRSLREQQDAEAELAGTETIARLQRLIQVEQAVADAAQDGAEAMKAAREAEEDRLEVVESSVGAHADQAKEIENLTRKLQAMRRTTQEIQAAVGYEQEAAALRRLTAAREKGLAAYQQEQRAQRIEQELRRQGTLGLGLFGAALRAVINLREEEAQQLRNQDIVSSLQEENELLRIRNDTLRESLALGLSYAEALAKANREMEIARLKRANPGLDEAAGRGALEEADQLKDDFEGMSDGLNQTAETLQATGELFNQVGGLFEQIGGKIGNLLSKLFDTASRITDAIQQINSAAGGGGNGLGGQRGGSGGASDYASLLAGLGVAGGVLAIFSVVYDLASGLIEEKKRKRFNSPVEMGFRDNRWFGNAVQGPKSPISQDDALASIAAFRKAVNDFTVSLGATLVELPKVALRIRNDGEKVELAVGDMVMGVFDSWEEAFNMGVRLALRDATFEGLGENTQRALSLAHTQPDFERFQRLIPILAEIDGVAEGLTASVARARLGFRSFLSQLDVTSEELRVSGVAIEDIIAYRQREVAAMRQQIESGGLALAGISSQVGALQEWLDQIEAWNQVVDEEADRQQNIIDRAEEAADAHQNTATAVGRGGAAAGLAGRQFKALKGSLDESGRAGGPAAAANEKIAAAFREQVKLAVELATKLSFLERLEAFQERWGIQLVDSQELQEQIAEMQFRKDQLELIMLAQQLVLAQEILGLTDEEIERYQILARQIADLEFPGLTPEVNTGGGRRQERRDAARDFRESAQRLRQTLAGATDTQLAYADEIERLSELARTGRIPVEELGMALSDLAALQVQEIAEPYAELARASGESELETAARQARERYETALADALATAAANPEAFQQAAAQLEAGFSAELAALVEDALINLGSESRRIASETQEAARSIRFLLDNLEEFGLTAADVAQAVADAQVPRLLDLLEAQAQRVGDEQFLAELQEKRFEIEQALARLEFESAVALLELAGALTPELEALVARGRELFDLPTPEPTDDPGGPGDDEDEDDEDDPPPTRSLQEELQELTNRGIRPALVSLRERIAAEQALRQRIDESSLAEEERTAALAELEADRRRAQREAVEEILGDIESLGIDLQGAGVDTSAFARALWEVRRAEVLAALASEEMVDAFETAGVSIEEIAQTVSDASYQATQEVQRDRNNAAPQRDALGNIITGDTGDGSGVNPLDSLLERLADLAREAELAQMDEGEARLARITDTWMEFIAELEAAGASAADIAQAQALMADELARAEEELRLERLRGLQELRDRLTQETTAGLSPQRAFEAAQQAFEEAVATGDPEKIAAAADVFLQAAAGFEEGYSRRAAEQLARQMILNATDPFFSSTDPSLAYQLDPAAALQLDPQELERRNADFVRGVANLPFLTTLTPLDRQRVPPVEVNLTSLERKMADQETRLGELERHAQQTVWNTARVADGFARLEPVLRRM